MSYNFKGIVFVFVLSLENFKRMIPGPEMVVHVELQQQNAGILALH